MKTVFSNNKNLLVSGSYKGYLRVFKFNEQKKSLSSV